MKISVVVPVYNEEENIPELYRRLTLVLEKLCLDDGVGKDDYEILMVDDGSSDGTWNLVHELHNTDQRVKGITFSRNFGHHIAVTAGVDNASGDAVVLMDADLQDPPEEIPKLYAKFKEGFDVVYAKRSKRDDSIFKKLTSWVYLRMLRSIAHVEIPLESGIFRIISSRCAKSFSMLRERSRFITGLFSWVGYSQTGVEIERHSRYKGHTKYTLLKLIRLAWHGMTSFSFFPLVIATYVGFAVSTVSFGFAIYMIIRKIAWGIPLMGYASLIVSIYFLGGVTLVILGIIGEYIGRVITEVQQRPLYVTKEKLN